MRTKATIEIPQSLVDETTKQVLAEKNKRIRELEKEVERKIIEIGQLKSNLYYEGKEVWAKVKPLLEDVASEMGYTYGGDGW